MDTIKVANKNKYIFDQYRIKQTKYATTDFEYKWHKKPEILIEPFVKSSLEFMNRYILTMDGLR